MAEKRLMVYTDRVADRIASNLRKFGYPNLTKSEVREICQKLVDSGEMSGGIIGMFAKKMLEENGYINDPDDI